MSTSIITKKRTPESFLKCRQIQWDLSQNKFDDIEYFIKWSQREGLAYALEWACFYHRIDIVQKLLDKGTDPTINPGCLHNAVLSNNIDMVKMLFSIPVVKYTIIDAVVLEVAIDQSNLEMVKFLLTCDIPIDKSDLARINIANSAQQVGTIEIIEELKKYGFSTDCD